MLHFRTATTDSLSHKNSSHFEVHQGSHKETATTIGKSSMYAMGNVLCVTDQAPMSLQHLGGEGHGSPGGVPQRHKENAIPGLKQLLPPGRPAGTFDSARGDNCPG